MLPLAPSVCMLQPLSPGALCPPFNTRLACLFTRCTCGPPPLPRTYSGGNVVGITINEYQVQRATYHNEKQGLAGQCRAVRGNFLDMPFDDNTFDGAYAMEATCHAPKLEQVRRPQQQQQQQLLLARHLCVWLLCMSMLCTGNA